MQSDELKKEKALIEAHIISLMQLIDEQLFKYRALFDKMVDEKCPSQ